MKVISPGRRRPQSRGTIQEPKAFSSVFQLLEDAMKTRLIATVASIGFTTLGVTGLAFAQDNANRQSGSPGTGAHGQGRRE
jgi:hypothetical protein